MLSKFRLIYLVNITEAFFVLQKAFIILHTQNARKESGNITSNEHQD